MLHNTIIPATWLFLKKWNNEGIVINISTPSDFNSLIVLQMKFISLEGEEGGEVGGETNIRDTINLKIVKAI